MMNDDRNGPYVLERHALSDLFGALEGEGYEIVAPVVRDGAVVYETVDSVEELPVGWTDNQEPGQYSLTRRDDQALFGYVLGHDSWKRYLHPPRRRLWRTTRNGQALSIEAEPIPQEKRAFVGVRACEIEAIRVQDRVFLDGPYRNEDYAARRANTLIVAVNCSAPASTCFCTSMGTGPEARDGYDIVMTELVSEDSHRFIIAAGSEKGAALLQQLPLTPAAADSVAAARDVIDETISNISRKLETDGLKAFLQDNPDHPQWDDVADRCLACGNCTSVCPTCFCTTTEDLASLDGADAERVERWDSCFTAEFSELGGGTVRKSQKSRYRQWMTHKLSTWVDQFGVSGCVGCGRCITWCPVGIDITEEARVMRAEERVS